MHIRIGASLLFLFYSLTACGSDPKAPNEANFRSAINAELAKKNPYCMEILHAGATGSIEPSPLATMLGKHGLLDPFGPRGWWTVSLAGKKLAPLGKPPSVDFYACTADRVEAKVVNWTEPTGFGATYSKVKYTIKPTKPASWVTSDIQPLLPPLDEKKEYSMRLVLTAKGWEKAEL